MRKIFAAVVAAMLMAAPAGAADKPSDAAALQGVKTAKVVWDINTDDPEKLLLFLSVLRETYDDLVRQDVEPRFVLAIHGAPNTLLTKDRGDLSLPAEAAAEKINALLDDLANRPGVRVEVCSVANRLLGIDNDSFREGIHVVGNTWVSLAGYQAQGYAMIPVH